MITGTTLFIGVDPGKATGVAHCVTNVTSDVDVKNFHVAAFTPWFDAVAYVVSLCQQARMATIISVERFTLGSRGVKTSQTDALRCTGAVEWITRELQRDLMVPMLFTSYGASDATSIGSTSNLKRAGWWTVSDRDQQRNRAAAQLAIALANHHPKAWVQLIRSDDVV